ncbi:YheT family hydrolase [Pseudodesulfovibrio portus]|uniref:Alpha/beta hydrolase n=1 Tax=Pseudodesulfovibrio portus TaxID=231439 RepID=A0ABN6RVX6_9BACT|nr:alpha/beta fold hydrolase [Pseudodesulfovibrio portus]BDQ35229.1 alpha/beta hydrolase [Pseudodesulfovibrio portus]
MPILPTPDYRPSPPFRFGNVSTLYPSLLRTPPVLPEPETRRVELDDGDFLDYDLHSSQTGPARGVVVISHGLEGNSRRKYVLGMALMATGLGFDAVCWSQRGCSSEPNRLERCYHSGETGDLHAVIAHCLDAGGYDTAALIGFSMGGNQILKYLGEDPAKVPDAVKAAAVFSVPCDLDGCEQVLALPSRKLYFKYFMRGLSRKIRDKAAMFPGRVDAELLRGIRTLRDFDDRFTAPANGFRDAADYYAKSSCLQFLPNVAVPALVVNSLDDPFMSPSCYPRREAEANPDLFLEMPDFGGHVGFVLTGNGNVYWSEKRAASFLTEILG